MCGISGFFSYKNRVDTKKYYEAHLKITHRGPDDEGFVYKNQNNQIEHLRGNDTIKEFQNKEYIAKKLPSSLILGHRRLSIIDLTYHGHQPFVFDNLYLVYNGEIYNYLELKEELQKLGYVFETETDTEVFLKAYHCWREEAFNKFNGMWAAAIYDNSKDEILLTRDRFGIKPLYYSIVEDNLIFGSEIKFVASFFDELNVNENMAYNYLRYNYINYNSETMFKDIYQLEPAHYLKYTKDGIKQFKYWELKEKNKTSPKQIENDLYNSIALRMRADVEVGSLLSGGIDSSTLLGIIDFKKLTNNFQTFSAVFKEEEFSEKKFIDKFKTKNIELKKHFIYPNPKKLIEEIDELLYTQEEPFRSLAIYSQYDIYRYIKEETGVKVLLNGQGADEIFTGYTEYYYVFMLELLRELKIKKFINEFKAFAKNRNLSYINLFKQLFINFLSNFISKSDKYGIFTKEFKAAKKKKRFKNLLKNALYNSLTFSALREYLRYEDRNSMRFSLESRLPFLDFNLVEDAFALEDKYKISNGVSKVILREIAKDKIPKEILDRKDKMGFVSPQELWQKTLLKDELDKIFENIKTDGLFDFLNKERLYDIYQNYQKNSFKDWAFIWRVYCLYKWKVLWEVK